MSEVDKTIYKIHFKDTYYTKTKGVGNMTNNILHNWIIGAH